MPIISRIYKRWCNRSITVKFGLGVGLLFAFMISIAATGYISQQYVRKANSSIKHSTEIQRIVLEMDRYLEKARYLHSTFFLQYPLIGMRLAHERYAQPSVAQIAKAVSLSKALKDMAATLEFNKIFAKNRIDLNLYLSSAKRFADTSIKSYELAAQLAAPKTGVEIHLDNYLTLLHDNLADLDHQAFEELFLKMTDLTKKYQVTHKRHLMQAAFNQEFLIRRQVNESSVLTAMQKEKILSELMLFNKTAEKILAIDLAIKAKFNDFSLQKQAADIVSDSLIQLAENEVNRSHKLIAKTHFIATLLLLTVSIAGLIISGFIFLFLNINISMRIVRLTRVAEGLREGNFNLSADDKTKDEIGTLAQTFNYMGAKLKELIEELEDKVNRRTAELTASERHFRQLFENSTHGIAVYEAVDNGADFIFHDINPAVERLEGLKRHDIIGKKLTVVFPAVKEFGILDLFRSVLKSGQSAKHPITLYDDGRLKGWRENTVYRLPDGKIVALYEDRTTEKQAEIDKNNLKEQLQRAKKMEAIGLMAGGVAHDLNNILAGIVGYPDLILADLPEESKLRAPIMAIHDSGKRAAAVVADLLTVARGVANTKVNTNLNKLLEEYLSSPEADKLLSRHNLITLEKNLEPQLKFISCSPIHIQKCIMNLVTNAMEAITARGKVIIFSSNQLLDEQQSAKKGLPPGEYVLLTVADTGTGISPEDLEHIFEPFYTKKVMGCSGTGLGLAIVWNSMQDHGGTALVESSEKGTSFYLYFPAVSPKIEETQTKNTDPASLNGNGEKILIVDDEPQLRDLARQILSKCNYNVEVVSSGEEAVRYLSDHSVDLLILDMIMDPGINGRQTYEQILKINPGQKALIASGFSESDDVKKALTLGASGLIKKPYSVQELREIVKKALGKYD